MMFFWLKIPWWKGSVRRCFVVMQQPGSSVSKIRGEVFAHFHAVAVKRHSSMHNWVFGLPERFICEQSSWCQRKWWAYSWLCSSPVSSFSVSVSLDFPWTAHAFFAERLFNNYQRLRRTFLKICTKFVVVALSDSLRNGIRPDARLQIKGRKNQHFPPDAWNSVRWLPRYASTIIYRCIALLQLRYRSQHQSRKLWIPLVVSAWRTYKI
jgi:hypothetical protein